MLQNKWLRFSLAAAYFSFTLFLFLLPGSAFPSNTWYSDILWFDKWVHIALFLLLMLIFCWAGNVKNKKDFLLLFILGCMYGIIVEVIQDQLIINRSFDWTDWIADIIGCVAGILIWGRYIKK